MSALVNFLVRLLLALATVVFVLLLTGVALLTMLGLMLWSLIRGRKPVIDVSSFARARQFRAGAGFGAGRSQHAAAEVVDVEVREIKPASPRLE